MYNESFQGSITLLNRDELTDLGVGRGTITKSHKLMQYLLTLRHTPLHSIIALVHNLSFFCGILFCQLEIQQHLQNDVGLVFNYI